MKARDARKNQVNTVIKEIKLRPKIDPHDYGTKKGHVERFLKGGDKVKVTIMFRGREQSRPELGFRLLQRLAEDVIELGTVESAPKQDGRNMIMVLAPTRKKSEAKAEQRRARTASHEAADHADEDRTEQDQLSDELTQGQATEDTASADTTVQEAAEAPAAAPSE
jgi:translation initiation factor IF-3